MVLDLISICSFLLIQSLFENSQQVLSRVTICEKRVILYCIHYNYSIIVVLWFGHETELIVAAHSLSFLHRWYQGSPQKNDSSDKVTFTPVSVAHSWTCSTIESGLDIILEQKQKKAKNVAKTHLHLSVHADASSKKTILQTTLKLLILKKYMFFKSFIERAGKYI